MLTTMGIKRKISMLKRLADPNDQEVNRVLQDAVVALNQLAQTREGVSTGKFPSR